MPLSVLSGGMLLGYLCLLSGLLMTTQKTYILHANRGWLRAQIKYRLSFLNRWLARDLVIPVSAIRQIGVHRLDTGKFWLTVSVAEDFEAPGLSAFWVFSGDLFGSGDSATPWHGDLKIGLWAVSASSDVTSPLKCACVDLYQIETEVQTIIGLDLVEG